MYAMFRFLGYLVVADPEVPHKLVWAAPS